MPRIYTSASDPIDFCKKHFPSEADAEEEFGDVGDGPDDRGNCFAYEAEHPPYDDLVGEYTCEVCNCELTAEDD